MKIYFSASARAKKVYPELISLIYREIKNLGYTHVTDWMERVSPEDFYARKQAEAADFYRQMVTDIKKADICIFETSLESAGIGFSINLALDSGKPVVALHSTGKAPYLLKMINHPKIQVLEYTKDTLQETLRDALELAKEQMDIRFTFFLTPKLVEYLDFIKKERRVARATFLRRLIEEAMKSDNDFKSLKK